MTTKSPAAYEIAMQMWEQNRRLSKPRPETFGLTAADVTDAPAKPDGAVRRILDDMVVETGVRLDEG